MDPRKLDIYLTVHGEESRTPDLQKDLAPATPSFGR